MAHTPPTTSPYRAPQVHALCTPCPAGPTDQPCPGCGNDVTPATPTGWCPTCAVDRCAMGNAAMVGLELPDTDDLYYAVETLGLHVSTHQPRPRRRLVDALLALDGDLCPECNTWVDHMDEDQIAEHTIFGGYVLVGCEGYALPALRAAALATATAQPARCTCPPLRADPACPAHSGLRAP